MKNVKFRIRAFTLLESLLVLFIVSFVLLLFTGSVKQSLHIVRGELFVLEFERLYIDTQHTAGLKGQRQSLQLVDKELRGDGRKIVLPVEVQMDEFSLVFDEKAGNSSLKKLKIYLPYQEKTISYQLELGSGKYKKTIH